MAVLQSTNVQGTLCVNGVAVGGGKDVKFCCITSSTTWTPPSDLVTGDGIVDTTIVAGGGGGGVFCTVSNFYRICNAAGGGGGGEVRHFPCIMTSSNDACTITVGAGGNSGSVDVTPTLRPPGGGAGGDSSAFGVTAYGGGGGESFQAATNNTCLLNTCYQNVIFGGPWGAIAGRHTCNTGEQGVFDCNPAMGGGGVLAGAIDDASSMVHQGLAASPTASVWCMNGKQYCMGNFLNSAGNNPKSLGYPHGTDYFSPGGTSMCKLVGLPGKHSYGEFQYGCNLNSVGPFSFPSGTSESCGAGGGAGSIATIGGSGTACLRGTRGNDGVVVLKWQQ